MGFRGNYSGGTSESFFFLDFKDVIMVKYSVIHDELRQKILRS
jgi:hypothetical protein